MVKKYLPTIITAAVLVVALIVTAVLVPGDRFKKNDPLILDSGDVSEIQYLSGMLLIGASEAPFNVGDVQFLCNGTGNYRYKAYGAQGEPETMTVGFDASAWPLIKDKDIISGTDCRKITVVSTDDKGLVLAYAHFDYVPGVIYGYSNPDQYDDPVMYNAEDPSLEDQRAVVLASNLFKTARTAYYGWDYGQIVQGFMTRYSYMGGILKDYYHTGTDFTIRENQPFYSPIEGEVVYADDDDDYNMIIIYNQAQNVSLVILHAQDITPATEYYASGKIVEKGALLGYGGGKGEPAGDTHIHIELRLGHVARYKSFSKDPVYTRMSNFDPLTITDMFGLTAYQQDEFDPYNAVSETGYNAQNNSCVTLVGNWLYYIDKLNGSRIYRARPDGTEVTLIRDVPAQNLNYFEGWLYYSDISQAGHITKTSADGAETVKLATVDTSAFIIVTGDWVYFANTLDRNVLFKVKHDGTEGQVALNKDIAHLFYDNGYFYYTQGSRSFIDRIYRFDPSTGESVQLVDIRSDIPFIYNGRLGFRNHYSSKNGYTVFFGYTDINADAKLLIPNAFNAVQPGTRYMIFSAENDANSLYVVFNSKAEAVKLTDDIMVSELSLQGGWLYYYTPVAEGNRLTRINVYGMIKQYMDANGAWINIELNAEEGFAEMLFAHRTQTDFPTPIPTITPIPTDTPVPPEVTPTPETTPTPEATPDGSPEATPEGTPEGSPEATPEGSPEATPEATPEGSPEATPEATPESSPEATPETTPDTTPDTTE